MFRVFIHIMILLCSLKFYCVHFTVFIKIINMILMNTVKCMNLIWCLKEGDETNKRQNEIPFLRFGYFYNATKRTNGKTKWPQILAELLPLTLRIFTYFSLSSQLLLHSCMDLNETWQGCCTTSIEVHVGR